MWDWQSYAKYSMHSCWIWRILRVILLVPLNIVMNMNNVMRGVHAKFLFLWCAGPTIGSKQTFVPKWLCTNNGMYEGSHGDYECFLCKVCGWGYSSLLSNYVWVCKLLVFLIGLLCFIGMWFGEDQKSKHHKDTCLKEIVLHCQILTTPLQSIVYIFGMTYVFNQGINKHALPITIYVWRDTQCSIQFLHMFHCTLANATWVLSCECN